MRINNKAKFAVCAMINLAIRDSKGPVTVSDLAMLQGLSTSYMEQLFVKLRVAGLVRSVRGPGGGYHVKNISNITVADIVIAVTPIDKRKSRSEMKHVQKWCDISERIKTSLRDIKLRDLIC